MKKIKILSILIFSFSMFYSFGQNAEKKNHRSQSDSKIELIDFHSTHRCMTCNAIEANTKYTLDTYFSNELKEEKIVFKTINVDDEKNYPLAAKFQASGTALFINVISHGREKHIDITDFAFLKGNDQATFSSELKAKINTELKKL